MHLARLRIAGFKSFVEPTELRIEPGLTGIVGPNGCGKSNLVDALRWAMGESAARRIRGDEMDDVIFAGAGGRPPGNLAEVSLALVGAPQGAGDRAGDGGTGEETESEIEIVRRMERGGGSVFRIDGRETRARDVQSMFADATGGARSSALVSQGEIGALIGARPTERRRLIEEAAGIAGLHGRRREAELRLRAAETNLERLDDVIAAEDAHLAETRRQARQAARYRTLGQRLRHAEAALYCHRWAEAEAAAGEAATALARATLAVDESGGGAEDAAAAQSRAAAAVPALRGAEAEAAAAARRLETERREVNEELRRLADAAEAARARLDAAGTAAARERELVAEAEAADRRLAEEAQRLRAARAAEGDRRARAELALAAGRRRVERIEGGLAAAAGALAETGARRESAVRRAAALEARMATLDRRAAAVAQERDAVVAALRDDGGGAAAEAAHAAAREREEARANALKARRKAVRAATRSRDAAAAAERAEREALRDAAVAHERAAAERDALAALLAGGSRRPLLDRLDVPGPLVLAVAAALGDDLLASDDAGAAAHWHALPGDDRPEPPPLPAGAQPLADIVRAPPLLAPRLRQVGVAARADGPALQAALAQGQRLVSREGDLWRWDGFVAAAEARGGAAARLAQRRRLARLESEAAALAARREAAEADAARAADVLGAALAALETARGAESRAARAVAGAARTREAARERRDAAASRRAAGQARLEALGESIAAIDRDRRETAAEREETARALAALPDEGALRAAVAARRYANRTARNDLDILLRRHAALARAAEARAARLAALDADSADWRRRRAGAAERLRTLADRRAETERRLRDLRARPARLERRGAALDDDLRAAEAERRSAGEALAAAETRLAGADRALADANRALARSREEKVRAEGAREAARARVALEAERIADKFDCGPADAFRIAGAGGVEELDDSGTLERRADALRRERDRMGAVNLRAEIEAAELDERIGAMRRERDDLVAAVARLRSAIGSLNREGRARLTAAFEEVDGHFRELFARLFDGGRAHLSLVGADDPLEAGLEIVASPPGKRPQTLSLLSGGEKALAALALLFAVFRTRPAPLCVLDEVDAPLDDANVERFCDLLDDIAAGTRTRFLVVTHHRHTMARMRRLYGVTMGERGVSQLVSVELAAAG